MKGGDVRILKVGLSIGMLILSSPLLKADPIGQDLYYGDTSEKFLIRWGFQAMCDHVFDPRTVTWPTTKKRGGVRFDGCNVKPGDLVFVRNVSQFMKELDPQIENPYILVTHGEHFETTLEREFDYLNSKKIIAWFSIHPAKGAHPRYYPLPLGIKQENEYFDNRESMNAFLKELRNVPKTKNVYVNFATKKNEERKHLMKQVEENSEGYEICKKPVEFDQYMRSMAECKFALSPRGFGPDSYRTWEALLVGTIPIVTDGQYGRMKDGFPLFEPLNYNNPEVCYSSESQLDKLYEGLPVLIIKDWKQLTPEFLHREYLRITSKKYDISRLYEDFWEAKIRLVQYEFLKESKTYNAGFLSYCLQNGLQMKWQIGQVCAAAA